MDKETRKEINKIKSEMDIFRECLQTVKPIVKEYYNRRKEENDIGYA